MAGHGHPRWWRPPSTVRASAAAEAPSTPHHGRSLPSADAFTRPVRGPHALSHRWTRAWMHLYLRMITQLEQTQQQHLRKSKSLCLLLPVLLQLLAASAQPPETKRFFLVVLQLLHIAATSRSLSLETKTTRNDSTDHIFVFVHFCSKSSDPHMH